MSQPLLSFERALIGKKILITGHTGFTGSWTCLWLKTMGVEIAGYALAPETTPALYSALGKNIQMQSTLGDICNFSQLQQSFTEFQPELVLHLAAQPLVRRSYEEPITTFATNTLGTAHVLEAARLTPSVKGVVCVTTDKVYKNLGWAWPYRENDVLGGNDPYSASKAAAEIIIQSYMASYCKGNDTFAIATARGGNIIGGGDWSEDRLIPDFVRAVTQDKKITLRYPEATRPWQHVLALVQGYLMLLAGLLTEPKVHACAWNLGPQDSYAYSVKEVLDIMSAHWRAPEIEYMHDPLPEASILALDSAMARNKLGWLPAWDTKQVIARTAEWYQQYYQDPTQVYPISLQQLRAWRNELLQGVQRCAYS